MKTAMQKHSIKGTLRLFGTPAEETTIGKVYMLLDGAFEDLDACLHWHPAAKNEVWYGSTKAIVSAKFTFTGLAAHASGNPDQGRSALDGVELMNVGVNFMREHVKSDARIHYVITDGGGAPNVVPPHATVWYYVRADDHRDVEKYYEWVTEIARGAAMMSRTKVHIAIDTDCHELIANTPLSEAIQKNLERIARPQFTAAEQEFARRIQETLDQSSGTFSVGFDDRVHPLNSGSELGRGSTDVGDISWFIPTGGLRAACFATGSPGHCWQNVAAIGSSAGDKGIQYAVRAGGDGAGPAGRSRAAGGSPGRLSAADERPEVRHADSQGTESPQSHSLNRRAVACPATSTVPRVPSRGPSAPSASAARPD